MFVPKKIALITVKFVLAVLQLALHDTTIYETNKKGVQTCFRNNMARYNGVDLLPDSCDTIDKKYGFFSLSMPT